MKYQVVFSAFTERHYIKTFAKKYSGAWDKTFKSLYVEFTYADILFSKSIAEIICVSSDNNIKICKTEFKVLGTNVSRHASGYRCIIAIHTDTMTVHVLLAYSKTDCNKANETTWWKEIVKVNYPSYKEML